MSVVVNVNQSIAIATFTTMIERVRAYRAGASFQDHDFQPRYGICDNIERCAPQGASIDMLSKVKDNIIRRVPSYSGAYHYPVKHPSPRSDRTIPQEAENAWNNFSNKWDGEYGAERLAQLIELLDHVANKWDDRYSGKMTSAQRVGIEVEKTIVMHRGTSVLYLLSQDDTSTSPYFRRLDGTGDRTQCFGLDDMMVVHGDMIGKMSVAAFMRKLGKAAVERAKLEEKMRALKAEMTKLDQHRALLDVGLAQQHGVKRLDK